MNRTFCREFRTFLCRSLLIVALLASPATAGAWLIQDENVTPEEKVSYSREVRPILAANCFGCHQGARSEGDYVMTTYDRLIAGSNPDDPLVVPGDPESSFLLEAIALEDGNSYMPPGEDTLTEEEIETIKRWIEQGAENDSARSAVVYDADNPPVYSRLPNITSIDVSPDGSLIAVTGFHEVLLLDANMPSQVSGDAAIVNRLIGLSPRVESVKFSPDGTKLAVSGGSPGESGEVQIWDVAEAELLLSKTVSFDTVYGVNWSPDGTLVSFGCTDTTLRAINAESGTEVLFNGAHEDWVRDTVFSVDGSQLISVGRDMTCKGIEVSTQRFIDNITSITPGVLKGGIASVDRHPERDEVVIGGSDGIPKVYRINRITKRVIGDDANMVRRLPEMPGRIQSISVSRDGRRIAAGSSLDGTGALNIYSYEFDPTVSDELKAILAKQPRQFNAQEREKVEAYNTAGTEVISSIAIGSGGIYATAFSPDGQVVYAAGSDGIVRAYETETGNLISRMRPVELESEDLADTAIASWHFETEEEPVKETEVSAIGEIEQLLVSPETIELTRPVDYSQLVIQAVMSDGSTLDVTSRANLAYDENLVRVDGGFVQAVRDGSTEIKIHLGGQSTSVPVSVGVESSDYSPDFVQDINPVLTRLGCNAGTCHGSATGKMGFKLSLRGYDPIYDIRAFTDDMGSRRTNLASPANSLMLLKPSTAVAHEGGQLLDADHRYYQLIYKWIESGAELDLSSPEVKSLQLLPENPMLADGGATQQMRVVATYTDGTVRDVTREAFIEPGDVEVAAVSGSVVEALRRGESPILARFEGAFTATMLTVMGPREGFAWQPPETRGTIDELVAEKWERLKIQPSGLCTDAEFVRRVYLDLTGLPPSAEQVEAFINDARPTFEKRDELVDTLIGNDSFVDHWTNKWADLMQVNRKYLGPEGAVAFRDWIREQVRENRPYDEFAYELLTATGSNRENPAASYFKIHRTPEDTMENTTHLFLATRFNCNKCHDHPFERWTQDQYYETAAYFAHVSLQRDPESGERKVGGSAVESAKPLYEIITDAGTDEIKHDRTGEMVEPAFPFPVDFEFPEDQTRRQELARWITSPDNPYFATSHVNRLWAYMTGTGLIEPIDDIRAGNPPTNPQLLEYLRREFIKSGFDSRHVIRLICKSRTYQLSIGTNALNEDDYLNYSHAMARRLPAEVLFDSIHAVTGSELKIPGVPAGTRAAALPDSGARLPSGFLSTLGRPARESVCECERANDLQLGSVLALVSGPDVARAIGDTSNEIASLISADGDDRSVINQLYMRILNRPATDAEIDAAIREFTTIARDHDELVARRDERQAFVDARLPELETARVAAIEQATAQLDQIIAELDPDLLKKEADRQAAINAANAALTEYKETSGGMEQWLESQRSAFQWHPVTVQSLTSQLERSYEIQEDRSVLFTLDKPGTDVYTLTTQIPLAGITGVRLELLPDESLPENGPGLAVNGNLVLTEFSIEVAHPDRPDQWRPVEVDSAIAYFEQDNFAIEQTFDGKPGNKKGWATSPRFGQVNWATYQLKLPVGFADGTLFRFKMHQSWDENHQIGRFRISLTNYSGQTGLSLPEEVITSLNSPAEGRSDELNELIAASFEKSDPRLKQLEDAVAQASMPLDIAPEIVAAREKLERVSRPVPPDSRLTTLVSDVQMSERQLGNQRLTAAQDLTWALINSPSFLFNR
ncbi:MAG: DUF1549 domain-containing protein [Planctomycetota bacterium]